MAKTLKETYEALLSTAVNSELTTLEIIGILELVKMQIYNTARENSAPPEILPP